MKEKLITKELAALYEKQGYFEDALSCYLYLDEQNKKHEFTAVVKDIQNKINSRKNQENQEKKTNRHWKKPSDLDSKEEDRSIKVLSLFEEWLNMIVLEKKMHNFKRIQANYE